MTEDRIASRFSTDQYRSVESDDIEPSEIEHKCEELFDGDALVQKYNYIVYHFDCDGRYFWARTYTHEIDTVSVFGPFDRRETKNKLPGSLDEAMVAYLKRRFRKIETLSSEGYVAFWSR
jgi:hypothetical protein